MAAFVLDTEWYKDSTAIQTRTEINNPKMTLRSFFLPYDIKKFEDALREMEKDIKILNILYMKYYKW